MLINNGAVNPALISLVSMQGLRFADVPSPELLNNVLQKEWVKAKDGILRAKLGGRFPNEDEMALLRQLGCVDAIHISPGSYHGTLVLGATLKAVTRRFESMLNEEKRNSWHTPQPVWLIGSNRLLDQKLEMPAQVPDILAETGAEFNDGWRKDALQNCWPKTEMEMMEKVLGWFGLAEEGKKHWFVKSVCAQAPNSNTAETIKEWLKLASAGHYLVVSSQPFCEGQKMAVERAVRESGVMRGYTFDVCGPAAPPLPFPRLLDNIAKQFWEEVQLLPK